MEGKHTARVEITEDGRLVNKVEPAHSETLAGRCAGSRSNHLEKSSRSHYDLPMISETIPQLRELTPEEKLTLSDELWREVTGEEPVIPDPDLVEKFNRRFAEFEQNPELGTSADDMKQRFKRNGSA